MKKTLLLTAISALFVACSSGEKNNEENIVAEETIVEVTEAEILNYYGEEITPDGAMASTELVAALEGKDSLITKVSGTINACCKKKGCWMDVDLGNGENMIVKFKDYGFFVPKNASGQEAIMEGIAKVETQTVDWLKHKAHDAGKTQEEIDLITESEVTVSFVATGVIIKGEVPEEEVIEEEVVEIEEEVTTAE